MSTDYTYDEQAQFFPFFILTISGLVTLPLTYSLLKPSKELESTAPRIKSTFRPDEHDLIQGQKKKQWRRERRLKRFLAVISGYAIMGYMIYLIIVTQRLIPKIWDPYDILGISRSASDKAIKKQYRRLTLQYHPDKVQVNEALNQTLESVTSFYVEISKAYKALTDEEVRNNYIQYGHPDGKQSFSIGIALPKAIITDGHGKYVLLVYGLLLGVLLPYLVGRWWYGTQAVTKDKILVASAGRLFQEYREASSERGIIKTLSSGDEYRLVLTGNKAKAGLSELEQTLLPREKPAVGERSGLLNEKDGEDLQSQDGPRRKALALLWAYLGRITLKDPALNDEKYEIAPVALALNDAYTSICLAYSAAQPLLSAYRTSQDIIQAVAPDASPLLQLPHITPRIAALIEGTDLRRHFSIQQYMSLPEYQRRKLSTDQPGALTPAQYNEAIAVARQLPRLQVERAFFKVRGERWIVPGSLVQFVIKCRAIPPGTTNVPAPDPQDLLDIDPEDRPKDDKTAPARRTGATGKRVQRLDDDDVEKTAVPPLAHAPYFPRDHAPRWSLFLAEPRGMRIAVPPTTFTTFDEPFLDAEGKPTFAMQTLKLQFQAPPSPGQYTFAAHLVCDSYIGFDHRQEVTMEIDDAEKAESIDSEDEISEPDEDSLAGQMSALKSGNPFSPTSGKPTERRKRKAAPKIVEEEEDSESDTEGDEESDTSETDTDTDGE